MRKMFSSATEHGDRFAEKKGASGQSAALSMIAADMRLEGHITSAGVVKIEGTVVGNVRADRQVLVSAGATVQGDIYTPEAIINGEVTGAIVAKDRTELHPSSVVKGDITTNHLVVQEGSQVNGRLKTGDRKVTLQRQAPRSTTERLLGVAVAS
jgi:cytoskeletal protein CcmA (bactofilin family)